MGRMAAAGAAEARATVLAVAGVESPGHRTSRVGPRVAAR